MRRPHKSLGLFALVLLTQTVGCVIYPFRAEVESRETASFDGVKKLAVDTRNGMIEVRCDASRKDVAIHVVRSASGITEQDAREHAEKIEIQIDKKADASGVLRVAAKMPVVEVNRSHCARFEIVLPPNAELDLHTRNGRITADGCARDVHADTSNGRIVATNCQGRLIGRTSNGTIEARDVAGDVNVRTTNGSIELTKAGKDSIQAETSNGHIKIVDGSGAATLRSSNGWIEMHCRSVPPSPRIQVVTSNGHVEVELPNTVSGTLDLSTTNGRVHADLKDVRVTDFESQRSSLRAKLNDGGGNIDVRSSNGSVTLRTTPSVGVVKTTASRS